MAGPGWLIRPTVWLATASMVITVLHELVHATVAYGFGVRSTLRNYFVQLHLTPEQAATNIPAIIGVAGPSFCLVLGIVAWVGFKRARGTAAELPLLYFAAFGAATFFGNLVSASFIGDFSRAAIALHLSMPARYALSLAGVVCVAVIHFRVGRELTRWAPPTVGRLGTMLGIIVVPVILGMTIVILANVPAANPAVRAAEASFWMFAAIGAWTGQRSFRGADYLHSFDVVSAIVAIVIVRVLVIGIPFEP